MRKKSREKYRKFDDARVGVNPFVPAKALEISTPASIAKTVSNNHLRTSCSSLELTSCICQIFAPIFVVMKVPLVLLLLFMLLLFHTFKYFLVLPILIRFSERMIDKMFTEVMLQIFAVMRWTEVFHKDDTDFDFVKAKKGELFVNRRKYIDAGKDPTIIIANDTSVMEYIWLQSQFSPVFVTMDYGQDSKAGLRAIGWTELVPRACGISFPALN